MDRPARLFQSTAGSLRQLTMFSLFWHFLDIIWIFIFTVVYLMTGSVMVGGAVALIEPL